MKDSHMKCLYGKLTITILALALSSFTNAEIYKWTDEQGKVHFSDAKPSDENGKTLPKVEEVELTPITIMEDGKVNNTNNETVALTDQIWEKIESFAPGFSNKDKQSDTTKKNKVEIYTTSWCGACKKAKSWLRSQGISYKEYDVEKNRNAAMRMQKLGGGGGVPFAVINGDTISGFSPSSYKAALEQ